MTSNYIYKSILRTTISRKLLPSLYMDTTKRSLSITESITNFAQQKIENNKSQQFMKMIDLMVATPNWTLRPWKATLESQLNSWVMRLVPGVSSSTEGKEIAKFKEILEAMNDKELDSPETINAESKKRISATCGKDPGEVTRLLHFYRQSLILQQWLLLKKQSGEKIPQNEIELQRMQETDIRIRSIANKVMNPAGKKKTGRGQRIPF